MIYRYRCNRRPKRGRCNYRVTLKRPYEWYIRKPRCPKCKGSLTLDKFRQSGREHAGTVCYEDCYDFPHARGRGACIHNPSLTDEQREQALRDYVRGRQDKMRGYA